MKRNCYALKFSALALLIPLLTGSLIADPTYAPVVIDNFNGGNDKFWVHGNPVAAFGGTTTYSFPGGPPDKGYRLQCTSAPSLPFPYGTARTFSYRPNVFSNFFVAVDLVTWDNSLDQALVILARGSGLNDSIAPGFPPGFGTSSGYVCNYDPNQFGAGSGFGQFQINRVTGENPTTIAAANITLTPGRSYRMTFTGVGTTLTAALYDLADESTPLVTISADDATYTAGVTGLISYSRDNTVTDVTYDNFEAWLLP
jgi:hypothetical protein